MKLTKRLMPRYTWNRTRAKGWRHLEGRIGKRFQVVIPKSVREQAGIREGDAVLIDVDASGNILILPKQARMTDALRGLGKEIWRDVDSTHHQRVEREQWDS